MAFLAGLDEVVDVGEIGVDRSINLAVQGASSEVVWWNQTPASQTDILRGYAVHTMAAVFAV